MIGKITKSVLTLLLVFGIIFASIPITSFAASAQEIETNVKYVDFELLSLTSTKKTIYMGDNVELCGGRVVEENGTYYLEIDYIYKAYSVNTATNEKTDASATIYGSKAYFKGIYNEIEIDFLEMGVYSGDKLNSIDGDVQYWGQIYTGRIDLGISSFSEAEGKEFTLKFKKRNVSTRGDEVAVLKIGETKDTQTEPTISLVQTSGYNSWDGFTAGYGKQSDKVTVGFTVSRTYNVINGPVEWYYTFDETEDITKDSERLSKVTYDKTSGQYIADGEIHTEAYDATIRVRGYDVIANEWLPEKSLVVRIAKKSAFSVIYDNNNVVGVFAGYNGLPYDTQISTEYITDENTLNSYGNQLKTLAGDDYGSYYAFTLNVTDDEGNKVKVQNETGLWGSGFYGDTVSFGEGVECQLTAPKQLYFNVDKTNGYWPTNTQVYYVNDEGNLVALPMYKTMLDVYDYTLTSWDWEGDPSGTYVVMQKPLSDLTTDTATGDYRVPATLVNTATDIYGNETDQWFSTPSEWNGNVGNSNLLHINVAEDGSKKLYLFLQDNSGEYITSVKYNNQICTSIERYTIDGKTYPKVVEISLTDADKNKAYVNIQVNDGNGWQDACLAIQYSGIYTYNPLAVSAPVIFTETGASNYVNDAQANISISADAIDGKIYYTTDGSEPTVENGTLYSGSFALETQNTNGQTYEVKAIVAKDGFATSEVASLNVTFKKEGESAETVATPTITARYDYSKEDNGDTAEDGYYVVSFETETEDAIIYYTLDGSVPTVHSIKYEDTAISVPAMTNGTATVIRAIAFKEGYNDSEIAEREIDFSTDWWDSLEEGDSYEVPAELINLGVYLNKDIKTQSMGASALTGTATVYMKNGNVYLNVPVQPINVSGIPGNLTNMWYYDGNDNDDGLTYARFFGNSNQEGAIEATYTYNDDGTVGSVIIPLFSNCEKVFVGLETNVTIMGKKGAIIWLDYSNVIESITGVTVEQREQTEMPAISYQYNEITDTFDITITAEEDSTIKYSVNGVEGEYEWVDYTGPFTISGEDAAVVDGATNVAAYAISDGKDDSGIAAEKLIFQAFGEDSERLEDGIYSVYVEMMNASNPTEYSMGNNAINHTAKLEVIDGEYYITLDFKGITIENRFGYLMDLYYYLDGYTYGTYGGVSGNTAPAEVLSTQKDSDGNDVIDQYNDENNLYPDLVKIKLVDQAIADEDGYVPLHVFVPIMEAIATGNGDQDVMMKIDWTSLKETTADDESFQPEEPVEQSPAVDVTDSKTGLKVHADKGVFDEGVQVVITEITSGADFTNATSSLADTSNKFRLYDVKFLDKDGNEVSPNGTVTISYPIADGYNSENLAVYRMNADGSKTLVKGAVSDGYYSIVTKSAGIYAVVEKNLVVDDTQNTTTTPNSNNGSTTQNNNGSSTTQNNGTTATQNNNSTNNGNTTVQNNSDSGVSTGQNTTIAIYLLVLLASASVIVFLLAKRKSSKDQL